MVSSTTRQCRLTGLYRALTQFGVRAANVAQSVDSTTSQVHECCGVSTPTENQTSLAGENCTLSAAQKAHFLAFITSFLRELLRSWSLVALEDVGVLAHSIAVSMDVDQVMMVRQLVDQSSCHDVVSQDGTPLLGALVPAHSSISTRPRHCGILGKGFAAKLGFAS